jgi:hypothetical protein
MHLFMTIVSYCNDITMSFSSCFFHVTNFVSHIKFIRVIYILQEYDINDWVKHP